MAYQPPPPQQQQAVVEHGREPCPDRILGEYMLMQLRDNRHEMSSGLMQCSRSSSPLWKAQHQHHPVLLDSTTQMTSVAHSAWVLWVGGCGTPTAGWRTHPRATRLLAHWRWVLSACFGFGGERHSATATTQSQRQKRLNVTAAVLVASEAAAPVRSRLNFCKTFPCTPPRLRILKHPPAPLPPPPSLNRPCAASPPASAATLQTGASCSRCLTAPACTCARRRTPSTPSWRGRSRAGSCRSGPASSRPSAPPCLAASCWCVRVCVCVCVSVWYTLVESGRVGCTVLQLVTCSRCCWEQQLLAPRQQVRSQLARSLGPTHAHAHTHTSTSPTRTPTPRLHSHPSPRSCVRTGCHWGAGHHAQQDDGGAPTRCPHAATPRHAPRCSRCAPTPALGPWAECGVGWRGCRRQHQQWRWGREQWRQRWWPVVLVHWRWWSGGLVGSWGVGMTANSEHNTVRAAPSPLVLYTLIIISPLLPHAHTLNLPTPQNKVASPNSSEPQTFAEEKFAPPPMPEGFKSH